MLPKKKFEETDEAGRVLRIMSHSESNKRILKNTLALYSRQIIIMIVSLFTSGIILRTLGVVDYGVNNVVGGVVSMLSFLTGSLSSTTQRFLNVEIGKNNTSELKRIFSNSLSLYLIFISIVIILAETVGLWFVKNKLVFPPERLEAAFWVYQFSIISFVITVFFTPFVGAIKAHEKFSFWAKMSLFDVMAKLATIYLLMVLPFDKLISLSFLHVCVLILGRMITYIFCHRSFEECRIKFSLSKEYIQRLLGFNFYKMIDAVSYIIKTQGLNVILNLYYGPVLNAAQGIANRVKNILYSFSNNAMSATAPQITKSYARGDKERLWRLVIKSSRLYFYLMLVLALPFILEIDSALQVWLGTYPEYATNFTRLFLLDALLSTILEPINQANEAVGKLKTFTITLLLFRLLILGSAVFMGMNKYSPVYIYVSYLILQSLNILVAMIIVLKVQLNFSLKKYILDVLFPILKTSLVVVSAPSIMHYLFSRSIISAVGVGFFTLAWSGMMTFYVGLNKNEKQMIIKKLPLLLRKRFLKKEK
jgi:O-antigen/teichoic acid export membrane protein